MPPPAAPPNGAPQGRAGAALRVGAAPSLQVGAPAIHALARWLGISPAEMAQQILTASPAQLAKLRSDFVAEAEAAGLVA